MLNAKIIKCNGEAHKNPHIDHCGVCMPYWGTFPVCPVDERKLLLRANSTGRCPTCRKFFSIGGEDA